MKFSLEWLDDHVDVAAAGGAAGVRHLLEQGGLPAESAAADGSDTILDVEITPNRPDAMGHRGLARDIAALAGIARREKSATAATPVSGESVEQLTSVVNQVPRLCRRFGVRLVRGIRNGPAPERVRSRLQRLGAKAISSAVDATNYGLWDTGQPLHAFDFDRLAGGLLDRPQGAPRRERSSRSTASSASSPPPTSSWRTPSAPSRSPGVMGGLDTAVTEHDPKRSARGGLVGPGRRSAARPAGSASTRTPRTGSSAARISRRFRRRSSSRRLSSSRAPAARSRPGLLDAPGAPFRTRRTTLRLARLRELSGDERLTLEFAVEALARLGFARRAPRQALERLDPVLSRGRAPRGGSRRGGPARLGLRPAALAAAAPRAAPGAVLEPLRVSRGARRRRGGRRRALRDGRAFPSPTAAEEAPSRDGSRPPAPRRSGSNRSPIRSTRRPAAPARRRSCPACSTPSRATLRHGRAGAGLFEIGRDVRPGGQPEAPESFEARRLAFALCRARRGRLERAAGARARPTSSTPRGSSRRSSSRGSRRSRSSWAPFDVRRLRARARRRWRRTAADAAVAVVGRGLGAANGRSARLPAAASRARSCSTRCRPRRTGAKLPPLLRVPAGRGGPVVRAAARSALGGDRVRSSRGQGLANLESLRLLDRYEGTGVGEGKVKTTMRLTFRAAGSHPGAGRGQRATCSVSRERSTQNLGAEL